MNGIAPSVFKYDYLIVLRLVHTNTLFRAMTLTINLVYMIIVLLTFRLITQNVLFDYPHPEH